ncbi:MAG: hypothetical protein NXY57DRAFT_1041618 [Lentinula lateritia]|nr:MAG: hypothetical protein NXY57DRAFT_1041618 [Lentinula lateritia]
MLTSPPVIGFTGSGNVWSGFLGYEVLVVNGKVLPIVIVILVVVVEFDSSMSKHFKNSQLSSGYTLEQENGFSVTVNALAVVGDLFIASILTYLLQRCKSSFKRTNTMINKLFLAAPNAFIYISFFFSMGRLYTNSLLTFLNSRQKIREAGNICTTIGDVGSYSSKCPKTFNIFIQVETTPELASNLYGVFQSNIEVEVGPKVLEDDLSDGA